MKNKTVNRRAPVSPREPAKFWRRHLHVTRLTPKSLTAFSNQKKICESHRKGHYRVTVIDSLKRTQLARVNQILAVPTAVPNVPKPVRTILATFPRPIEGLSA